MYEATQQQSVSELKTESYFSTETDALLLNLRLPVPFLYISLEPEFLVY